MREATINATPETGVTVFKSHTPCVYVPRWFHMAPVPGIRRGAAIVGTPQGEGTIAIDVFATDDLDPTLEVWSGWIREAVDQHMTEADVSLGEAMQTRFVSEHDVVQVGDYEDGRVIPSGAAGAARLIVWVESGPRA